MVAFVACGAPGFGESPVEADLLSYLFFDRSYTRPLVDLGFETAAPGASSSAPDGRADPFGLPSPEKVDARPACWPKLPVDHEVSVLESSALRFAIIAGVALAAHLTTVLIRGASRRLLGGW